MPDKLKQAFDFNESDISLNQNGQLSEKQLALLAEYRRIRRLGGKLAFGMMVITTVFFIGIWLYAVELNYNPKKHFEMTIGFVSVVSLLWGLVLFFSILGKIRSDLNSQRISTVEGYAVCKIKTHRNLQSYLIKIGNVKFQPGTSAQYKAIKPDGHYRVFYIKDPPPHIILSIAEI